MSHNKNRSRTTPNKTTKNGAPPTLRNPPLTPHSPPSLPQIVLEQIEDGWNTLSQKRLLTVSIPDSYKVNSEEVGSWPFPRLTSLFKLGDGSTAGNPEDDKGESNISASADGLLERSPQQAHHSRDPRYGRPSSAPPQPIFKKSTTSHSSSDRLSHLQLSKIEVNSVPDEVDFIQRRYSSGCFIPEEEEEDSSVHALHKRRMPHNDNDIKNNNNNNDSRSSISSQWSCGRLDNEEVMSHTDVDEVPSGSQSALIDKGIKLLKTGQNIMQNSRSNALKSASLQEVANTLHGLVMGQLQVLQQENEMLRVENVKLKGKSKSVTSTRSASFAKTSRATLPRITASPVQKLSVPGCVSSNYTGNRTPASVSSSARNAVVRDNHHHNHNNQIHDEPKNRLSTSFDLNIDHIEKRVQFLEESVSSLVDHTSAILERLYQQEIRYEDTLGKFEDIVATLSTLHTTTQQNEGPTTSTNLDGANIVLNNVTEQLATLVKSNRKVQFKGILKK